MLIYRRICINQGVQSIFRVMDLNIVRDGTHSHHIMPKSELGNAIHSNKFLSPHSTQLTHLNLKESLGFNQ